MLPLHHTAIIIMVYYGSRIHTYVYIRTKLHTQLPVPTTDTDGICITLAQLPGTLCYHIWQTSQLLMSLFSF